LVPAIASKLIGRASRLYSCGFRYWGTMRVLFEGKVASVSLDVPTLWQLTRQIRSAVLVRLSAHDPNVREATALVASELAENAIKYGLNVDAQEPLVTIEVQPNMVRIRTLNASGEVQAHSVLDTLARIAHHEDPGALYAEVIEKGIEEPRPGVSQQGFYRIAAVGGFSLEGKWRDGQLEIVAERRLT
jgi:hypothetical protein